jgi:hypothetical protein
MLNTRWTGPDPVTGAGRNSGEDGVGRQGRFRPGARVAGEFSRDRSGLDDVWRIIVDDPLDVLGPRSFSPAVWRPWLTHGHGPVEAVLPAIPEYLAPRSAKASRTSLHP